MGIVDGIMETYYDWLDVYDNYYDGYIGYDYDDWVDKEEHDHERYLYYLGCENDYIRSDQENKRDVREPMLRLDRKTSGREVRKRKEVRRARGGRVANRRYVKNDLRARLRFE